MSQLAAVYWYTIPLRNAIGEVWKYFTVAADRIRREYALPMRLREFPVLFACLAVGSLLPGSASAAIPEPPHQHDPWQPVAVSGLPDFIPEMTEVLFDMGLPDPRGGEYRQIEIHYQSSPSFTFKTHGWYFPQGFAIGWGGLIYSEVTVGAKANLEQDVMSAPVKLKSESNFFIRPYEREVSLAMLLRLGEIDLARQFWATAPTQLEAIKVGATQYEHHTERLGWFEYTCVLWLGRMLDAAISAHALGDNGLAVDLAQSVLQKRAAVQLYLRRIQPASTATKKDPLAFLDTASAVLGDSQRRLKESPQPGFDPDRLRRLEPAVRIAAMIQLLDRLRGLDLAISVTLSPIGKMLADEGANAVEPLLDVMDHDRRLTLAYRTPRGIREQRYLVPVSQVAKELLLEEYQIDEFGWRSPADLRAWLIANKLRSPAERVLDLLADDANSSMWLDAARLLMKPNKQRSGIVGDELRSRRDPSISDWLLKRSIQMNGNWAEQMALLLYQWDPAASLPALQAASHQVYGGVQNPFAGTQNGRITAARLRLGDHAAAEEWVLAVTGDHAMELEDLEPLWAAPNDETLQGIARKLFLDPGAPMALTSGMHPGFPPTNLIHSPLLIQPVFRQGVLDALERKEPACEVERMLNRRLEVRAMGATIWQWSSFVGPFLEPAKWTIGMNEYVASILSQIDGFPEFSLEWNTEDRSSAVARISEILRTRAGDLRDATRTGVPYPVPTVALVRK